MTIILIIGIISLLIIRYTKTKDRPNDELYLDVKMQVDAYMLMGMTHNEAVDLVIQQMKYNDLLKLNQYLTEQEKETDKQKTKAVYNSRRITPIKPRKQSFKPIKQRNYHMRRT